MAKEAFIIKMAFRNNYTCWTYMLYITHRDWRSYYSGLNCNWI